MTPPPGRPRPPSPYPPEPRRGGPGPSFSRPRPTGAPATDGARFARAPPASSERARPAPDRTRRRMLDVSREGHFKYDLREILLQTGFPPEKIAGFHATVVSKGARIGTQAAKEFVTAKVDEQMLTRPERDAIVALIDRYSRWR